MDLRAFTPDTPLPCAVQPSPNHGDRRGRTIDSIVLHYTGMASAEAALQRLCDPSAEVSSHYLIDEGGKIFQLVPEDRRAWHAGRSYWHGERDMNSVSIGIEIANAGHDGGLPPYPGAQIEAVIALGLDISGRHGISAARVLAHSDIAPGRKVDPGPKFPWSQLAAAGLGLWPTVTTPSDNLIFAFGAEGYRVAALQRALSECGFDAPGTPTLDKQTVSAIAAFHLHFRPAHDAASADRTTAVLLHEVMRISNSRRNASRSA